MRCGRFIFIAISSPGRSSMGCRLSSRPPESISAPGRISPKQPLQRRLPRSCLRKPWPTVSKAHRKTRRLRRIRTSFPKNRVLHEGRIMAEVTAVLVKELREKTGAGMMDCKRALDDSAGDIEAAVDWLRKKGLSAAAKKAGRIAAEGLIGITTRGPVGAVVEVNSETDFVARNK